MRSCFLPLVRRAHALRDNSIEIIRASAQKILPMLIPALAAMLRVLEGDDGDVGSAAALVVVVAGGIVGDAFVEEEEEEEEKEAGDNEDDDESAVATTVEETPVDDDDAIVVGLEPLPSKLVAERPHVCGATASFDVISKVGVLAKSSPEKSSSCMWQTPLL